MRNRCLPYVVLVLAVLAVSGCQIEDPYAEKPGETSDDGALVSGDVGEPKTAPSGSEQTAARFAAAWIDWTSNETPEARQTVSELSATSLEEELLAGSQTTDALSEARVSARVEGVIPKAGGQVLIVTQERVLLESGGGQAQYAVYLARVEQTENGWEVTEWTPVL